MRSVRTMGFAAGCAALLGASFLASAAGAAETRTYAVSWLYPATQQRDDDCGNGMNPFGADLFQVVLKDLGYSKADADKLLALYPSTPGNRGGEYIPIVTARGRNKENVYQQPESTPDPGIKLITGKFAPGLNLDGKEGANDFIETNTGERGIDNQYWRAIGCIQSHRSPPEQIPNFTGAIWDISRDERPAVLMEISGIDDFKNDPDVTVRIMSSFDAVSRDANGKMRADSTFRIDPDPRWQNTLKGRIDNGVLTTEPVAEISMRGDPYVQAQYRFKHGRVRMELTRDGGLQGVIGGYQKWRTLFWRYGDAGWVVEHAASVNVPGLYYALKRLADADPDPKTGENTTISSAYRFDALPALLVQPAKPAKAAQPAIAATVPQLMPAGVVLRQAKGQMALHDEQGRGLYVFDGDAKEQTCSGDCAAAWPILAAPEGAKPFGDWTIVARAGGSPEAARQWAWRGRPLYRSVKDEKPGDATADGTDGNWHLAWFKAGDGFTAPYGLTVQEVPDAGGLALVDAAGMTIYAAPAAKEAKGAKGSAKDGACLSGANCWIPVAASGLASATGDFMPVDRPDGGRQWAWQGQLLYTYGGDRHGGEATGAGIDGHQVALKSRYFVPAGITMQRDEAGRARLVTADGRMLYAKERMTSRNGHHLKRRPFTNVAMTKGPLGCEAACLEQWKPLAAPADAASSDYWRVVVREDGSRQWSYQGFPLYTYAGDKAAGEESGEDEIDFVGPGFATYWRTAYP